MNNNKIIIGVITGVLFFIYKTFEQKMNIKRNKDYEKPLLKNTLKDVCMVILCSIIALFIVEQCTDLMIKTKKPNVFVNEPDF